MKVLESHRNLIDVYWAAQREASRLGHETIGPEHILLGLVAHGGRAAEVLGGLGVDLERTRAELRLASGRGPRGARHRARCAARAARVAPRRARRDAPNAPRRGHPGRRRA